MVLESRALHSLASLITRAGCSWWVAESPGPACAQHATLIHCRSVEAPVSLAPPSKPYLSRSVPWRGPSLLYQFAPCECPVGLHAAHAPHRGRVSSLHRAWRVPTTSCGEPERALLRRYAPVRACRARTCVSSMCSVSSALWMLPAATPSATPSACCAVFSSVPNTMISGASSIGASPMARC
jgi:hypothetical protein